MCACDIDVPFRIEHSIATHSLHFEKLCVSALIATRCDYRKKKTYTRSSQSIEETQETPTPAEKRLVVDVLEKRSKKFPFQMAHGRLSMTQWIKSYSPVHKSSVS